RLRTDHLLIVRVGVALIRGWRLVCGNGLIRGSGAAEIDADPGAAAHSDLALLLYRLAVLLPADQEGVVEDPARLERRGGADALGPLLRGRHAVEEEFGVGRHHDGHLGLAVGRGGLLWQDERRQEDQGDRRRPRRDTKTGHGCLLPSDGRRAAARRPRSFLVDSGWLSVDVQLS